MERIFSLVEAKSLPGLRRRRDSLFAGFHQIWAGSAQRRERRFLPAKSSGRGS
jgi:hypothetical protein